VRIAQVPAEPATSASGEPAGAAPAWSNRRAAANTMSENCWCTAVTSARRDAAGEATPDCLRAAARTYRRAFSTAASAMPRSGVVARSTRPGLQVPRSPSVFQSPVRSSVTSARRQTTSTWSLGGLSGVRRAVARIASAYSP